MMKAVDIKSMKVSQDVVLSNDKPFVLIAGPCQMESRDHSMKMAESLKKITSDLNIPLIYKSSFDKANRTSVSGKRGIGLEKSLPIFEEIKKTFNLPVLTDVHTEQNIEDVKNVVNVIQIPAFLCRQTDLLKKAAESGLPINIKKGQFLAPQDAKNIAQKFESFDNNNISLTERGVSFGYNNLIVDIRSFPIMKETGYPVIIDATHATQSPGGLGGASGGNRDYAPILANAALTTGIAGVFMEVHENPDIAPSDGPCMIKLENLKQILTRMKMIDQMIKNPNF
jgi:2-dehydro-3-deoxyphosphooctonate aldolase (KDO 8-P synthase)